MCPIWLPEPPVEDNTWSIRDEQPMKWLERSTLPQAKNYRQFLNNNLSQLPVENQKDFYSSLHLRFKSAFFELIVARTLQILGAEIKIEAKQKDDKQPDFHARFAEHTIVVEAASPNFNTEVGNEIKESNPLYEIIETLTPEGWTVGVWELPQIGLSDSKKEFKRAVSEMLNIKPPSNESEELDLIQEISTGDIKLHLVAKRVNNPSIIWEAPVTTFVDTKERIRKTIEAKKKRRQTRAVTVPALLAIEGSWLSDSLEDYDMAIYGHTCEVVNERREIQEPIFEADGIFANLRAEPPTYAGALIFPVVGMKSIKNPVLYNHPRFEGELPNELSVLEQRIYEHGKGVNSIQSIPSKHFDLLETLGYMKSY